MKPLFKNLSLFLTFLCLLACGLFANPASGRLKNLTLKIDTDWIAEVHRLEDEGVPIGEIYEALIIRLSVLGNIDALVALYRDIERKGINLPFGEDRFFETEELRDGFVSALGALYAARWKDITQLRTKAKDAFLKNPSAFEMLDLRDALEEAQQKTSQGSSEILIPMNTQLFHADSNLISLSSLLGEGKALYLDFWASWCGPCLRAMPELKDRALRYPTQGIAIAAVNTDAKDPFDKAKSTQQRYGMEMPWLIESQDEEPISGPLRITSIPRVILLNPEGRVLFNGHPDDIELKLALIDMGVAP